MAPDKPQQNQAKPLVRVQHIVKTFGGVKALDDVSLDLLPGEVHCLAGENGCGKSTLIKIISGAQSPDAGTIIVDGVHHSSMNANEAIKTGIHVIYQDFSLFPDLTVAENISMTGAVAERDFFYSARKSRPRAEAIVRELGLDIDLDAEVGQLSIADKQLTAICRALASNARVVIMDEPTTALTHSEVERLFETVEQMRKRGVALMFVSHKLDEVMQVSQQVTIMRSGRVVVSERTDDLDADSITLYMTGRKIDNARLCDSLPQESPVSLEVEGLSAKGLFSDVSFSLKKGEILGITGLLGSGRAEIAEALFGVLEHDSGTIRIDGKPIRIVQIQDAIKAGIGYVPEDRLTQGLFLDKSIADNLVAASLPMWTNRWGLLDPKRSLVMIESLFERLRIKAPNVHAAVRSLSGGNAQRVVLAKWIAKRPKILILNGPTVGVDVGSKREILEILVKEASEGTSVIVISDDLTELAAVCHRVLIIRKGRIVGEMSGDGIDPAEIEERMSV